MTTNLNSFRMKERRDLRAKVFGKAYDFVMPIEPQRIDAEHAKFLIIDKREQRLPFGLAYYSLGMPGAIPPAQVVFPQLRDCRLTVAGGHSIKAEAIAAEPNGVRVTVQGMPEAISALLESPHTVAVGYRVTSYRLTQDAIQLEGLRIESIEIKTNKISNKI